MAKTYSVKYFQNQLKKVRLTLSKDKSYKTIDELFMALQNNLADYANKPYLQNQGNEK